MENKEYKTPIYIRNAVKRYEEKHKDRISIKAKEKYKNKKHGKELDKEHQKTEWSIDDLINNFNKENKII